MKPLVVVIMTKQVEGKLREYTAYDRAGRVVDTRLATDCGYGAKQAHTYFSIRYRLSTAPWTIPLIDKYRHYHPWETPRLQRCK
jgi:hypothetical protein